uniref:PDEase domain-containing protein n=1 Tax=Pinguiococcus pyrenoidosus TaxID=172671 RepID=A0A7R9UAZ1_9STRA|mmetsp:Transcript_2110/g.9251  ORF Transcript_2110/g.9251 Transcript_2110/m.9251 type:complete len:413 (+) Transcript_2110:103-1341(+)|eukprot:scaffold180_cov311-Pinguiococcus_pyrenoidosus.AAC.35
MEKLRRSLGASHPRWFSRGRQSTSSISSIFTSKSADSTSDASHPPTPQEGVGSTSPTSVEEQREAFAFEDDAEWPLSGRVALGADEDLFDSGAMVSEAAMFDAWDVDILSMPPPVLLRQTLMILTAVFPEEGRKGAKALPAFLRDVFNAYQNRNPFHNFAHVVSVVHVTDRLLAGESLCNRLSGLERFSLVLAALCHDVGHPGLTNAYLVARSDPLAIQHNDDAVLERHHCAATFQLLRKPENGVLVFFSDEAYRELRKVVIHAILHTDMAQHGRIVRELQQRDPENPWGDPEDEGQNEANALLLRSAVVHAADLNGQAQPWDLANKWGDRVLQEFRSQAKGELRNQLPLTGFMHSLADKISEAKVQKGFVRGVVLPIWQGLSILAPEASFFVKNAEANARRYEEMIASFEE